MPNYPKLFCDAVSAASAFNLKLCLKVTFWKHDKRSIRQRKRAQNLDEKKYHLSWNEQYKIKLDVPVQEIPTVFIGMIISLLEMTLLI